MAIPSWYSGVNQIFSEGSPQVPAADWLSIVMPESGGNANAVNLKDPNGGSYGLFQDNLGGQGAAYRSNPTALLNPITSAKVSAPAIRQAYAQGLGYGYVGSKLAAYTATHSGHPGYAPAGSILPPKWWPSYGRFQSEANAVQSSYQQIASPGGLASTLGAIGYGVQVAPSNTALSASGGSGGGGTWASMLKAWDDREKVVRTAAGGGDFWTTIQVITSPRVDLEGVFVLAAEVIVALLLIGIGLMAMLGIGISDVGSIASTAALAG